LADGQTIILGRNRETAHRIIDAAPMSSVLNIKPPRRTIPQNDRMWAMLGELARARPDGRNLPPHVWKALAMDAAGNKPIWERSLDELGMVCVGYKSSRLTVAEMGDVMMAIEEYGARKGVRFGED
jgi:hypothetical protein